MFRLTERGEISVKGKGMMRTYFVDGLAAAAGAVAGGEPRSAPVLISSSNRMMGGAGSVSAGSRKSRRSRQRGC